MNVNLFYFLIYPILLLLSVFAGIFIAKRIRQKGREGKQIGVEGALVSFYALVISFSLAQAATRHHDRSLHIHDTGDKLALIIRKSQMYEPMLQQRIKPYFREFFAILLGRIEESRDDVRETIKRLEILDRHLDTFLISYAAANAGKRQEVIDLITSLEQMEDIYYRLLYSYHERTPRLILFILVLFSLLIGVLMGFVNKVHHDRVHITIVIFVIISILIIGTIHDLDTPDSGLIKPNFEDIQDVKECYQHYLEK